MATGKQHVDLNERRLRPIYDCLDNGNNKKAVQEADKLMKKQKEFHCAKVLKALALLRLDRKDNCVNLLEEVHVLRPTDDPTLQAMTICYRELQKPELIADAYDNAAKREPTNEEFLSHLFMAYVRCGNYKKQQQTAMALYKIAPKNPYYFWAIMSIIMQAHTSENSLACKMYLPLAERMLQKFVREEKVEAETEVQLYLNVLEMASKHQEALHVLEGPLGAVFKVTANSKWSFRHTKRAELWMKLEQWQEANSAYKQLINEDSDQWQHYAEYFKSMFALVDSGWQPETGFENGADMPACDYTVDMALNFVGGLAATEDIQPSKRLRGPYLAQLELLRLLRARGKDEASERLVPQQLLLQYFEIFGDKACCYSDLAEHLDLIGAGSQQFLAEIRETMKFGESGEREWFASGARAMQRHVCWLRVCRRLGDAHVRTDAERRSLAEELTARHREGLSLGHDLLSTDMQYSDDYCIMAVHVLYDVWCQSDEDMQLWKMCALLETALKSSPSNFHMKLLLIKLYSILGVYGPSVGIQLELRHIQWDTLGYMYTGPVLRVGHYSAVNQAVNEALRFFSVNYRDTSEYIISAYKYGSFTKVLEFVRFRERLNNSLQFAVFTAEKLVLDLMMETSSHASAEKLLRFMDIDPEDDKTKWEDLRDNRDLDVMLCWDPPEHRLTEEQRQQSFSEQYQWLKLRNFMLRAFSASMHMCQSVPDSLTDGPALHAVNGNKKNMPELLESLIGQLEQLLKDLSDQHTCERKYPLQGPFSTLIHPYMTGQHSITLICLLKLVHSYQQQQERIGEQDDGRLGALAQQLEQHWQTIGERVSEGFAASAAPQQNGHQQVNAAALTQIVLATETLSHSCLLIGICDKLLQPMKPILGKKSKKKKEAALHVAQMMNVLASLISKLEKFAQTLQATVTSDFLSLETRHLQMEAELPNKDAIEAVWAKAQSSYAQSGREIGDMIELKLKYVASFARSFTPSRPK